MQKVWGVTKRRNPNQPCVCVCDGFLKLSFKTQIGISWQRIAGAEDVYLKIWYHFMQFLWQKGSMIESGAGKWWEMTSNWHHKRVGVRQRNLHILWKLLDSLRVLSRVGTISYLHFRRIPLKAVGRLAWGGVEPEVGRQGRCPDCYPRGMLVRVVPDQDMWVVMREELATGTCMCTQQGGGLIYCHLFKLPAFGLFC